MKNKIPWLIVLVAIGGAILYFTAAYIVGALVQGGASVLSAISIGITDYRAFVFFGCGVAALTIVTFVRRGRFGGNRILKINSGEDGHFLTDGEMRRSDNMVICNYSELGNNQSGIPVYAKRDGKDITVILAKPSHTLVIGTTGSGKTSGFVEPTLQTLSRCKDKPCLVLTDPKGELYRNNVATLQAQGYIIHVIDLMSPYTSARWNPFQDAIEKTRELGVALDSASIVQKGGKYYYRAKEYLSANNANAARSSDVRRLNNEIFLSLQDVVFTLCPITSKQEPVWENAARNFILAITVAMWEDMRDGLCEEQQFNLLSLYRNVSKYAIGELDTVNEYLHGRDDNKAAGLANTIMASTDRTRSSYLSQVNNYMVSFADGGICEMTAENDIDLTNFDEQPTALFLKIPDEKVNRHGLVTLFVTQLYKTLVGKARWNVEHGGMVEEKLKRIVYIIMDEFGNMPKFESIDRIITVGRSRGVFVMPIIQDNNQIVNKYGAELAGIIKSNCNIKIFIGSTDIATCKEFSELCGKTKQRRISFSDGDKNGSVSTSAESVPLIYASELERLNDPPKRMGKAIVLAFGKYPIYSEYTPVFKAKDIYKPIEIAPQDAEPREFDESMYSYDIMERNVAMSRVREFANQAEDILTGFANVEDYEDLQNSERFKRQEYLNARRKKLLLEVGKFLQCLPSKIVNEKGEALRAALDTNNLIIVQSAIDSINALLKACGNLWALANGAKLSIKIDILLQKFQELEEQYEYTKRNENEAADE